MSKEIFQFRWDGRIEQVCEHGVGHTVWFPKGSNAVHGCDGCCSKFAELSREEILKRMKKI